MENLHAIMLLAWTEYKANRLQSSYLHPHAFASMLTSLSDFRTYTHSALQMAQELGLSETDQMIHLPDAERRRRQLTWTNLVQLHGLLATRA